MKKKFREIVVNEKTYAWRVGDEDCDGDGGLRFKIWKDRKLIYEEIIHNDIITPQVVKDKILEINED